MARVQVSLAILLLMNGCSGLLTLDERSLGRVLCDQGCPPLTVCVEGYCAATEPCTLATAASEHPTPLYCPDELLCRDGLCVETTAATYCDCAEVETCVAGVCLPAADDPCSSENPDGRCAGLGTCRAGQCVRPPDADACSPTNAAGYCPPGFTCVRGYCEPVTLAPCSPEAGMGLCEWGYACRPPGPTCVLIEQACSVEQPQGVCPPGELCIRGSCQCVPCAPFTPAGCCADGQTCAATGMCIPLGTCADNRDCHAAELCSCLSHAPTLCDDDPLCAVCIWDNTCRCDEDCAAGEHCDLVSHICQRNLQCGDDGDCGPGECCGSANLCLVCGTCNVLADCRGPGEFCCDEGRCQPPGGCCNDSDCAAGRCLEEVCRLWGECSLDEHCAPGHLCMLEHCVPDASALCTDARVTGAERQQCDVADRALPSCCPIGEVCCDASARCSAPSPYDGYDASVCIPGGRCLADADCLTPTMTCNPETFTCEPAAPCPATCPLGSFCSAAGACVPDGRCASVFADCPDGEICNESYLCERATGCGELTFDATRVKPNVLIVLDRSGSTQLCQGDELQNGGGCCGNADDDLACGLCSSGTPGLCDTCGAGISPDCTLLSRWEHALSAVDNVTQAYSDVIRFGLATYPRPWCGASACRYDCNYCSCDLDYCTDGAGGCVADRGQAAECHPNYEAGVVNVVVDEAQAATISVFLAHTYPGGGTPTGPTLRALAAAPAAAGIAAADRSSFVVLITDGAANGDVQPITGCRNTDFGCKVNKALDQLRTLPQPVNSYVVGFAFDTVSDALNCHADHGARSNCPLPLTCANIAERGLCEQKTCVWDGAACVAPACTAMTDASDCQALGCAWSGSACSGAPSCSTAQATCYYEANDAQSLVTELGTIIGEVASCSYALDLAVPDPDRLFAYFLHDGVEERIERDRSGQDGWDFSAAVPPHGQVVFHGAACERIKSGQVIPLVILGCCTGEGC